MRTARIGDLRLVASTIAPGAELVRVHPDDGPHYDRMIVVTVHGDTVHLMGWIGTPLTPSQWSQAAAVFFPAARRVRFERMQADGSLRHVTLPLANQQSARRAGGARRAGT